MFLLEIKDSKNLNYEQTVYYTLSQIVEELSKRTNINIWKLLHNVFKCIDTEMSFSNHFYYNSDIYLPVLNDMLENTIYSIKEL